MKKHVSVLLVLMLLVTAVSVIGTSAAASEENVLIYKFTFEDENATSILKAFNGDYVGEIVEWPEDSGNHCLRYELNEITHRGFDGCHPYIYPEGIDDILAVQGDLEDTKSTLQLNVDFAYTGSTEGYHYMFPLIIFNDEEENYADGTYYLDSNEFDTGTFTWSQYDSGAPVAGRANGGILFADEWTLEDGNYMYVDNIELSWVGEWTDVGEVFLGYPNGTFCEESDLDLIESTTTTATGTTAASEENVLIYKFTFEDENATSILKAFGGEYVGEIVEWPEDSGNHCLRYELNEITHRGRGGCHPYIYPEGIDDILAAQGDLEDTKSTLQLNVDFAYAGSTRNSWMYPCIIFNDEDENYADHSSYAPGSNEFNTGTFIWSAYEYGAPVAGHANGGIPFVDDRTLVDGNYMYVDNIELSWDGEWTDVGEVFLGYPNGTFCEESDLDLIVPTTTTATETTATATETATEAEPTSTATETATEPTATEAEPTATEAEPTATETATEAESTSTATETEPTSTATTTVTEPIVTEPIVTETQPAKTIVYGDANGDGVVNMKDVLTIRKYVAGITVDIDLVSADTNGDGVVNMKDVLTVRKFVANIIPVINGGKTEPTEVCYPEYALPEKVVQHNADGSTELFCRYVYTLDENNRLVAQRSYDADDNMRSMFENFDVVYDEDGNVTSMRLYDEEGNITWYLSSDSAYDENGNVVSETWYDQDGNPSLYEYSYDEKGNLLTETRDGVLFHRYEYVYNDSGKLTLKKTFDSEDALSEEAYYDENGNVVKKVSYWGGAISGWTEYTFDDNGSQTSYREYNADSSVIWSTAWDTLFDENGRKTSVVEYNEDGSSYVKTEYVYDENGSLTLERGYNGYGNNELSSEITYRENGKKENRRRFYNALAIDQYLFDENGNLIAQQMHAKDGSLLTWYEYIYYDQLTATMLNPKSVLPNIQGVGYDTWYANN